MRLKKFEDPPQNQQRSLVQSLKKAVRTRWLIADLGVESVYKEYTNLLHVLWLMIDELTGPAGSTASGVLKKMD